ncbi:hypothetical protein [Paenibacillus sp.]|uniref:hypothetical protein n=1 Tax=Paenibacillus sp. TaxID=58172 RepID=UPI002D389E73|nr:hypothetical protein [Paenibacillus sp.]HZG56422.1 hypothetical protein [Paenibacillus sp.]
MRVSIQQQQATSGDPERLRQGAPTKGGLPEAAALSTEFAAEPGFRAGGTRSANTRVHKS